jgi:hypothetical protein
MKLLVQKSLKMELQLKSYKVFTLQGLVCKYESKIGRGGDKAASIQW